MRSSKLLGVVIVLQVLVLAGQWLGTPQLSTANAQVNDPGRDRMQMLDELKITNAKLDKLVNILASGELKVRVIQPDESKGKPTAR